MNEKKKTAIIISASSDIGSALSQRWLSRGWSVLGTYRKRSAAVEKLARAGAELFRCDLLNGAAIKKTCRQLAAHRAKWDALVLCPGTLEPVGHFMRSDFNKWEKSIQVNFISQMRIVHSLLPSRQLVSPDGPCVLFFAGGGTNSAPVNYSAYTISKIALIKMTELLDAEIPDTRFAIIGPGWVGTKIHQATLKAKGKAGGHYQVTVKKLKSDELTPMDKVLDHCDWVVRCPKKVVGGRNFSTVFDPWGAQELEERLAGEPQMYKLRRFGNEWFLRHDR